MPDSPGSTALPPPTTLARDATLEDALAKRLRGIPRFSVRTYAFLLVVATAVPLGALSLAELRQVDRQDEAEVSIIVRQIARITAAEADLFVSDARGLLEQVAERPAVRAPGPAGCDPVFADFSLRQAPLANLLLVDTAGRPVCSTLTPLRGDAPYRERDWFKDIVQGASLVVDAPHRARRDNRWIVTLAVPVRGADGNLRGVLATSLDLARLRTPTLRGADLPEGSTIDLIDRSGILLARSTGPDDIGSHLTGELIERALTQRVGVLRGVGADGVDKMVGVAPLATVAWTAVVSTPAEAARALARRSPLNVFAALAILAGILMITAIVARRMLRPIRSIAAVADAVTRGDLAARARVSGPRELADIAADFNRMLDRQRDETARRDSLERQRAEAEVRESEARFRLLADSAPSLIWMAGADGSCVYVNRRWIEFTDTTLEQACGDGWVASVHPEDRQAVLARNAAAFERGEPFSIEYRLRRHDGEYRWMLNDGAPRFAEGRALIGYIGTCVDIHGRVSAERRIRRLSTLYAALSKANEAMARTRGTAALLQQVCDIAVAHGGFHVATIGLIDEEAGCVREVAAAGETLPYFDRGGLSLDDESWGEVPSLIAIREDRPCISNDRAHDPRARPIEHRAACQAIRATAALPLHREGRVTGCLTVHASELDVFDAEMTDLLQLLAADLSFALDTMAADQRREQAEGALRQLNATLEQKVEERTRSLQAANRELEAFSYSVSHDLRAPLRAISGFTELIAEDHMDRLDHEARGYLERVRAASQRMARLIDDLMNLCRIARMELSREPLDLSRLAAEAVAELQEGDPQRAVQVRITPGLTVEADRGLTQILLANLLGNAWKFTARRAGPAISFGLVQRDGRACYFVRDNGAGFDMRRADKLFAPFQRLHAEHEFAGTGIGLALVQRIVQRHGGSVTAESAEGEGTTVYFTLRP